MFGETECSLPHRVHGHDSFLVTWVIKTILKKHPPKARENSACSKHSHQLSGWEAELQPVPGQEAVGFSLLCSLRGASPRDGAASLNCVSKGRGLAVILKTSLNSCGIPLSLHFTL